MTFDEKSIAALKILSKYEHPQMIFVDSDKIVGAADPSKVSSEHLASLADLGWAPKGKLFVRTRS